MGSGENDREYWSKKNGVWFVDRERKGNNKDEGGIESYGMGSNDERTGKKM